MLLLIAFNKALKKKSPQIPRSFGHNWGGG